MTIKKLTEAVKAALEKDPTIAVKKEEIEKVDGHTLEHMESLGLTKSMLKKLEAHGHAIRGYSKNTWVEGETMPSGIIVKSGERWSNTGSRVRWILVGGV